MNSNETKQINPLSGYDFCYKAMSDADRNAFSNDMLKAVEASCEHLQNFLRDEAGKAVEKMYSELVARPFSQIVRDEATPYEYHNQLVDYILESLENTDPSKIGRRYCVERLIKSWFEKFPESAKQLCDSVLVEENRKLKELYDFQVRVNERRF